MSIAATAASRISTVTSSTAEQVAALAPLACRWTLGEIRGMLAFISAAPPPTGGGSYCAEHRAKAFAAPLPGGWQGARFGLVSRGLTTGVSTNPVGGPVNRPVDRPIAASGMSIDQGQTAPG